MSEIKETPKDDTSDNTSEEFDLDATFGHQEIEPNRESNQTHEEPEVIIHEKEVIE